MSDKKSPMSELKRLRDEIRVKLDLASKETKSWWENLEPQLTSVEDKLVEGGEKVADVSKAVGEELVSAFKRIRDRIGHDEGEAGEAEVESVEDKSSDHDASDATDAEIVDD
ncbi:MAG: hypothetical protein KJO07_22245 [Deltaproteobacteria bacterium]|nr:hypothetical protein [Deltaproteobacteria bacterium]